MCESWVGIWARGQSLRACSHRAHSPSRDSQPEPLDSASPSPPTLSLFPLPSHPSHTLIAHFKMHVHKTTVPSQKDVLVPETLLKKRRGDAKAREQKQQDAAQAKKVSSRTLELAFPLFDNEIEIIRAGGGRETATSEGKDLQSLASQFLRSRLGSRHLWSEA